VRYKPIALPAFTFHLTWLSSDMDDKRFGIAVWRESEPEQMLAKTDNPIFARLHYRFAAKLHPDQIVVLWDRPTIIERSDWEETSREAG
jgi:hypothetical protein